MLEYKKWGNFLNVIEKAKEACENAQQSIPNHFADVGKMVSLGSGSERQIDDIMLSRYACYLTVMNGDPRKKVIRTHYQVGKKVRQTIAELGRTMPENLPTPEKSIKQIEKE